MKFYGVARTLYLETGASGIGFGAGLLQMRDGMNYGHEKIQDNAILQPKAFASKRLSSIEQCYSSIEHEALGMLHGLERSTTIALQWKFASSLTGCFPPYEMSISPPGIHPTI